MRIESSLINRVGFYLENSSKKFLEEVEGMFDNASKVTSQEVDQLSLDLEYRSEDSETAEIIAKFLKRIRETFVFGRNYDSEHDTFVPENEDKVHISFATLHPRITVSGLETCYNFEFPVGERSKQVVFCSILYDIENLVQDGLEEGWHCMRFLDRSFANTEFRIQNSYVAPAPVEENNNEAEETDQIPFFLMYEHGKEEPINQIKVSDYEFERTFYKKKVDDIKIVLASLSNTKPEDFGSDNKVILSTRKILDSSHTNLSPKHQNLLAKLVSFHEKTKNYMSFVIAYNNPENYIIERVNRPKVEIHGVPLDLF